jgi:hypothetical protein
MGAHLPRHYDPTPTYVPVGGPVRVGWAALVGTIPAGCRVVAVDGPAALNWEALAVSVREAGGGAGRTVAFLDIRGEMASWDEVVLRTDGAKLADDPDFAPLASGTITDLFHALPRITPPADGVLLVYGPGAALVEYDVLWYADLPKRFAEAAITAGTARNLGQDPHGPPGSLKRLFYQDWPLQDRHRDTVAAKIDQWVDAQDMARPTFLDGAALRATLAGLAAQPFRTRPTFNTTSWGGHWAQQRLGVNPDAPNTALGYELIAPESGVLIGARYLPGVPGDAVELPFQLLVALHAKQVLGAEVHANFGTSFPIRFDYLDTLGGGNLSVHCHPRDDYMREIFGWPYTQHETYYVMVGGTDRRVYLGLRDPVDLDRFHQQAHDADDTGTPLDIEDFVQWFPATPHQLFLVPAGTPHGSGAGNVVLEVSATPYLYSLRFYDWLRQDGSGRQRAIHVDHAFRNLNAERRGEAVRTQLIQTPRTVDHGPGWREELLGRLPEMFFDVRRLVVQERTTVSCDTAGRFHVLNVVDGAGVLITTAGGSQHFLRYAETLVVPAAVGGYALTALGPDSTRIVKALVR